MADYYYRGEYSGERDYKKAFELYEKASSQGDKYAQLMLGECYLYGNGVEQSYEKAFDIFTKLAEKGYKPAQRKLAEIKSLR